MCSASVQMLPFLTEFQYTTNDRNENAMRKDGAVQQPLISVIVPVYNVSAYLDTCLSGLVRQTLTEIEIILIDDGSQDQSPALCDHWAQLDPRIRVVHKSNGGLSSARNMGIDMVKGEYLSFVDSDDTVHPQMMEILFDTAQRTGSLLVGCDYKVTSSPVVHWPTVESPPSCSMITRDSIFHSITVDLVVAWNKLYHHSLFSSLRYPVGRYHEDEFLAHRIFWQIPEVAWVRTPLYGYLQRPGSIMSQNLSAHYEDALLAYRDRIRFCREQGRIDYLQYSLDTLLSHYEILLTGERDPLPDEERRSVVSYVSQDFEAWKKYMRPSQKVYWHWLSQNPTNYQKKKRIYSNCTAALKRFVGKRA